MDKGKLRFSVWLYAALAFASVMLGNVLVTLVVAGAAMFFERHPWLTNQMLQAAGLAVLYPVLLAIGHFPYRVLSGALTEAPRLLLALGWLDTALVSYILPLLVLVLVVIAIVHVAGGKDARVPLIAQIVDAAYRPGRGQTPPPAGSKPV